MQTQATVLPDGAVNSTHEGARIGCGTIGQVPGQLPELLARARPRQEIGDRPAAGACLIGARRGRGS